MTKKLLISAPPHIRGTGSTRKIMLAVIIALLPALGMSVYVFGPRALVLTAVSVASCVLFEFLFNLITHKSQSIDDLSAIVTGMLLAFNVPASLPFYMIVIGAFAAIVVAKMLFGGIGHNFANPALVGRIVLMLSFTDAMSSWPKPGGWRLGLVTTTATPLAGKTYGYLDMFLGNIPGSLGEVSTVALLVGGLLLICARVIKPTTPLIYIGTVFLFSLALGLDPVYQILAGGLVLGAFFMATDYSSAPYTPWGRVVFAIGCGMLTVMIRVFANYPEGVSFAILFMNLLTPWIDKWTRPEQFGSRTPYKTRRIALYVFIAVCALIIAAVGLHTILTYEEEAVVDEGVVADIIGEGFVEVDVSEYFAEKGVLAGFSGPDGYAVLVTQRGFNPEEPLTLLVGVDRTYAVTRIVMIQNAESPGYGADASNRAFLQQYVGARYDSVPVNVEDYTVIMDSVAGATVTREAIYKAVRNAIEFSGGIGG